MQEIYKKKKKKERELRIKGGGGRIDAIEREDVGWIQTREKFQTFPVSRVF